MALIPGRARVLELKWTRGTAREKVKCCHPSRNFHPLIVPRSLAGSVVYNLVKVARRCTRASFSSIDQAICESKRAVKEREERSLIIPFLVACSRIPLFTVDRDNGQEDRPVDFYRLFREFRENWWLKINSSLKILNSFRDRWNENI